MIPKRLPRRPWAEGYRTPAMPIERFILIAVLTVAVCELIGVLVREGII